MNGSDTDHERERANLPALLLGGLDAQEETELREHIRGCMACERALGSYLPARDAFALAAPQVDVPEGMVARLLEKAERAPVGRWPIVPPAYAPIRRVPSRLPWVLAAACFVLALLTGGWAWRADSQAGEFRTQAVQRQQTIDSVVDLMERGDLLVRTLHAADSPVQSRVYEAREGDAGMLVFDGLPKLPEGRVYELWLGRDGRLSSVETFTPTAGGDSWHKLLQPAHGFDAYDSVAVAVSPPSGLSRPPDRWLFRSPL